MKEKNPLLSIIVPVYNVEQYIEKCLNSIINQSYSNLEVILINDGSKDKSGYICDEFSKKDSRIKVIHKENEGQSVARNLGIKIASGELIGFVDSDDYINLNMYEILYNVMKTNEADVVECAVEKIYADKVVKNESDEIFVLNGIEALERHLSKYNSVPKPRAAVWARLHKKSIVEDLEFPVGKIHEDFYFTYRTLLSTKKYCWIDRCLYSHIYTNSSSTTQLPFSKRDLAKIEIFEERMNYLINSKYVDLGELATVHYFELLLQHHYKAFKSGLNNEANELEKKLKINRSKISQLDFGNKKNFEFKLMLFEPALYRFWKTIYEKFI